MKDRLNRNGRGSYGVETPRRSPAIIAFVYRVAMTNPVSADIRDEQRS